MEKKKFYQNRFTRNGRDKYGRKVKNKELYDYTARILGEEQDMVEAVIMYLGVYTASCIEAGLHIPVIFPGFGKFVTNPKKLVKQERMSLNAGSCELSPISQEIVRNMRKDMPKVYSRKESVPVSIAAILSPEKAIWYYKQSILSIEDIKQRFGNKPAILENLLKEIKLIDYYRKNRS